MSERHSEADVPVLISDPLEVAQVESENALRQYDAAMDHLDEWLANTDNRIRPSQILRLHGILLEKLSPYAGNYRPSNVDIKGSRHAPPPASKVPSLIEDLCDYINDNWGKKSSVHLSAYILWRLNWIHAFVDGNGRTARIFSYFVLCAHCRTRLPGDLTIPEQIAANKAPYYDGLEAADRGEKRGIVDLSDLEDLLSAHLANQLYDFHRVAAGQNKEISPVLRSVLQEAVSEGVKDRKAVFQPQIAKEVAKSTGLISWIENHPSLTGLIGLILTTLITLVVTVIFSK